MRISRRTLLQGTGVAISASVLRAQTPGKPDWRFTATVAESCSCSIPCPCNFGLDPNRKPCNGNRLIAIRSGRYNDVDLSGVAFLITFGMRDWSKIYVSDRVNDQQVAAVQALLPIAFAGFQRGMLSIEKAPLKMELTESHVAFSVPESSVEMEVMRGAGGKPVKIVNLPNPAYQDYTQFRSVVHRHESAGQKFSYAGTNGFTSIMDAGS